MKDNEQSIGVITEVGDLGCGYEELSESDKEKLKEDEEK